jgi:hypothetical protein
MPFRALEPLLNFLSGGTLCGPEPLLASILEPANHAARP